MQNKKHLLLGAALGLALVVGSQLLGPAFGIEVPTALFLLISILFLPAASVYGYIHLKRGKPLAVKKKRYGCSLLILGALSLMGFGEVSTHEMDLFKPTLGSPVILLLGLAVVPAMLLQAYRGWLRASPEERSRFFLLLPRTGSEMRYWVPLSLLAGFGEEVVYRGAAFIWLGRLTHSFWVALGVCVVTFAVLHIHEGFKGMVAIGLFGFLMHTLVLVTSSLYLAIVIHSAYDLLLGLGVLLFLKLPAEEEMVKAEPAPQP